MRNFMDLLRRKWDEGKYISVGLDPSWAHPSFPHNSLRNGTLKEFNTRIIDATRDIVCAYKPNLAFYNGWKAQLELRETIEYIHSVAPDVPVILDAKFGDIESTNAQNAKFAFEYVRADAVTVSPYLGRMSLQPFLDQSSKGVLVLVHTSNEGADEFQDIILEDKNQVLYERIAENVARYWNYNGNVGVVAGGTYPEAIRNVRNLVGEMPMLIPGIGTQGGDIEATVKASITRNGKLNAIINSSSGIIYAFKGWEAERHHRFEDSSREETLRLHNLIEKMLTKDKERA